MRLVTKKEVRDAAFEVLRKHGVEPDPNGGYALQLEKLAGLESSRGKAKVRAVRALRALGVRSGGKREKRWPLKRDWGVAATASGPTEADLKNFYASFQWRKVRFGILKQYGRKCMCCGQTEGVMHVDHIKPLRFNWSQRLNPNNLQVLCEICNHGKGNWDTTDFRPLPDVSVEGAPPWDDVVLETLEQMKTAGTA